jgi:plastocyanin
VTRVRVRLLLGSVLALIAVAAVAGCGQGSTRSASGATSRAPSDKAHLTIANYAFAPRALTVKAGTSITVKNADQTAHTATARSGAFDSGTLKPGQSARLTFKKPGTYKFYCQFHAFMTGTITVVR